MSTFPLNARVPFRLSGGYADTAALQEAIGRLPGVKGLRRSAWAWTGGWDAVGTARKGALTVDSDVAVDPAATFVSPSVFLVPSIEIHPWVDAWLLPFQQDAVRRLNIFGGGHLWSSPGSGKTAMGIVWALSSPTTSPVIAITRAGSRPTWDREIRKLTGIIPWLAKPATSRLVGDVGLPTYMAQCEADRTRPFLVLGYEALTDWLPPLRDALNQWATARLTEDATAPYAVSIVFDEIHRAKQYRRGKNLVGENGENVYKDLENIASSVAKLARMGHRRLATTATPIPNRVRDLWAQLDAVQPGLWGTFWPWAARYADSKEGAWGFDTTGASNKVELRARLDAVTVAVPFSVSHAQLPAKRREVRFLLPEEQNAEATGFVRELKLAAIEERGSDSGRTKELKLTLAASRKRSYVLDEVKEAVAGGLKVLVFTNRRALRVKLTEAIERAVRGSPVWGVDGDDSVDTREAARLAYMGHKGGCVFVATGDSMGEGVDLQDTDLFLVAMLPYTPGQLWQWENRVYRLGMTRAVIVRYIVAVGTYDEKVAAILLDKLPAVDDIVGDEVMAGVAAALEGVEGHEDELLDSLVARVCSRPRFVEWEEEVSDGDPV